MTPVEAARARLRETTVWHGDRLATLHWWSDARLLRLLGPALAQLHPAASVTVVAGVQSSGYLLAPLAALPLGVGMLGIQKLPQPDGSITLATAAGAPGPGDAVLLVDDVVETGAQALAVRELVLDAGASWLGTAVLVTYTDIPELNLKALAHIDELRPVDHPGFRNRRLPDISSPHYGCFLERAVDLRGKPGMLGRQLLTPTPGALHA